MLNPELLERPPHLHRMAAIDLAAGLGGVKVMRAAVSVEAHRQAVLAEYLLAPGRSGRALLLGQERLGCPVASSIVVPGLDPGIRSSASWPSSQAWREPS